MEYTINNTAKLVGISSRTLRYYDEIGLLKPKRISSNGYRIYGQKEIERLKEIIFYKEMGLPLDEIQRIISSKEFDGLSALKDHLENLLSQRNKLDDKILNVVSTIRSMRGEDKMSKEDFEEYIEKLVDDNEIEYGEEVRREYGNDSMDKSNHKLSNMTREEFFRIEKLTTDLNQTLKEAVLEGDTKSDLAKKVFELHKEWLCFYWDDYSKDAHLGVTQMYVDDPRFFSYYENIAPSSAIFLRDVVINFAK